MRYMSRPVHVSRPRASDDGAAVPSQPYPLAIEPGPVDTGLLDMQGRPIWRIPDRIGFLPDGRP